MSQIKRRAPIHNILLQALVLFAFLGPVICGCDNEPSDKAMVGVDFGGTWEGHTIDEAARVTFEQSNGKYTLDYGVPYSYEWTAEKVTLKDYTLRLRITETNGGEDFYGGTIILTMTNDRKHVTAEIQHEKIQETELKKLKAELEKTK